MKINYDQIQMSVEELVDRIGIDTLADLASNICWEKAEHIRTSYNDTDTSKEWEKTARDFDNVAGKIREREI